MVGPGSCGEPWLPEGTRNIKKTTNSQLLFVLEHPHLSGRLANPYHKRLLNLQSQPVIYTETKLRGP